MRKKLSEVGNEAKLQISADPACSSKRKYKEVNVVPGPHNASKQRRKIGPHDYNKRLRKKTQHLRRLRKLKTSLFSSTNYRHKDIQ